MDPNLSTIPRPDAPTPLIPSPTSPTPEPAAPPPPAAAGGNDGSGGEPPAPPPPPVTDVEDGLALIFPVAVKPSFEVVQWRGRSWALVRPARGTAQDISSRCVAIETGGKKRRDSNTIDVAVQTKQVLALIACLYTLKPDGTPGRPFLNEQNHFKKLLNAPVDPDGVVEVLGAKAALLVDGKDLSKQVDEAKNA